MRPPERAINCAEGDPLAAPVVHEREPVSAGALWVAITSARCSRLEAGTDTAPGGTVSISSMSGKRRVVARSGTGGWGCVGASGINMESMGRLPAASKSGDSYCQMGEDACGSGVRSLVVCAGGCEYDGGDMTCW